MLSGVRPTGQLANDKNPFSGSRSEMERFYDELPGYVKEELRYGKLRFADTIIYSIKKLEQTIKMFQPQDDKEIGLRNISNGKLPKNQCLLVSGIWMLASVAPASLSKDDVLLSNFQYPQFIPALLSGEFTLKANQKCVVPETPNAVFRPSNSQWPDGYYKLHNPLLIVDEVPIEFTIELGTAKNLNPNSQVFIGLHGTITTP